MNKSQSIIEKEEAKRYIITSELEELKGQLFDFPTKANPDNKIKIDFEIRKLLGNYVIHIDKTVKDFWRIYWHLQMDGGLDSLRKRLNKQEIIYAITGGGYVNKEGKEYGEHGCYITIF